MECLLYSKRIKDANLVATRLLSNQRNSSITPNTGPNSWRGNCCFQHQETQVQDELLRTNLMILLTPLDEDTSMSLRCDDILEFL